MRNDNDAPKSIQETLLGRFIGPLFLCSFVMACILSGCSGTILMPALSTYEVQVADLQDNGYPNTGSPRQSSFASFTFQTDAGYFAVTGTTTMYNFDPEYAQIGLRIDGVDQTPLTFKANTQQVFFVPLDTTGTLRTIELRSGAQSDPSGVVMGSFIDAVAYPPGAEFAVVAPTVGSRILFYGDSITVGSDSKYPTNDGYTVLLRDVYGLRVMVEGWGYRSLFDDAATSTAQGSFTARIASFSPVAAVFFIGTNDYGLNRWPASDFGRAYASTLDKLHAASPEAKVFCVTPIPRISEVANSFGDSLGDYRSQISSAAASRPWVKLIDGTAILSTGDLDADGVHPTTAGQAKLAKALAPYL